MLSPLKITHELIILLPWNKGKRLMYLCQTNNVYFYGSLVRTDVNIAKIKETLKTPGEWLNYQDKHGHTALILATKKLVGAENIVDLLIKAGAKLNITDEEGNTALIVAVNYGNSGYSLAEMLVGAGADKTIKNNQGDTALKIAKKWSDNNRNITLLKNY